MFEIIFSYRCCGSGLMVYTRVRLCYYLTQNEGGVLNFLNLRMWNSIHLIESSSYECPSYTNMPVAVVLAFT